MKLSINMNGPQRTLISLIILCLSLTLLSTCIQGVLGQSDHRPWPMLGFNAQRTGTSPFNTTDNNGQLKWMFVTDNWIPSCPVIGSNDTIYFQTNNEPHFYAVSHEGKLLWQKDLTGGTETSPAIAVDGTIYFTDRSSLIAYSPEGAEKWRLPLDPGNELGASPALGPDGTIYLKTTDKTLNAISPNGKIKWKYSPIDGNESSPAVGPEGVIYINSYGGGPDQEFLLAITTNGQLKWKFATSGFRTMPAVGTDGTIYSAGREKLFALTPDGKMKWSFTTDELDGSPNSPAIGPDHSIYFTTQAHPSIYSISADGKLNWKFNTTKINDFSGWSFWAEPPAISKDGVIFISTYKGRLISNGNQTEALFAIEANGTLKWIYLMPGSGITSSAAIGSDGTVYIGSPSNVDNGIKRGLIAIGNNSSVFQDPPPQVPPPDDQPTNNTSPPIDQSVPPPVKPLTPAPEKITPVKTTVERGTAEVVVATISVVVLASVLMATDVGQFSYFSFASMFYTKKKQEEILDNFIRGQLYGRISECPGLNLSELSRKVGSPTGTIVYHLRTLEREGLIKTCRQGLNKLFFSSNVIIPEGFLELKPFQRLLLSLIEKNPGISQQKLSKLTQVSAPTINRHIHDLEERSFIMISKGSSTRCYIIESG
jgi:outer membrane protein assembly factor BamB/predicted transcriptional regulator